MARNTTKTGRFFRSRFYVYGLLSFLQCSAAAFRIKREASLCLVIPDQLPYFLITRIKLQELLQFSYPFFYPAHPAGKSRPCRVMHGYPQNPVAEHVHSMSGIFPTYPA